MRGRTRRLQSDERDPRNGGSRGSRRLALALLPASRRDGGAVDLDVRVADENPDSSHFEPLGIGSFRRCFSRRFGRCLDGLVEALRSAVIVECREALECASRLALRLGVLPHVLLPVHCLLLFVGSSLKATLVPSGTRYNA